MAGNLPAAPASADAWDCFSIRYRSRDRKHGEPFPLPRLCAQQNVGEASVQALRQRVDMSFKALNALASVPVQPNSAKSGPIPITSVQKVAMEDIWRRVSQHGEAPSDISAEGALRDLLARTNLYGQEATTVVPMDLSKIRILQRELRLQPAEDLLPPEAAVYIKHHDDFIAKSATELEADRETMDPINPYWDPALRDDFGKRVDLYRALDKVGLLTSRRRRRGRVAFFTVRKKDGMQRLIVDARDSNSKQKRPPTTRLSSPASFMDVQFDGDLTSGFGDVLEARMPCLAAGDVGDCFYNFSIEPLSSWFCTDDKLSVRELRSMGFHIDKIYDDNLGRRTAVRDDEPLWFSFAGICMGWSWALYFANEIVARQCALGANLGPQRFLRDKQQPPSTSAGPLVGVYVDNVNVLGCGSEVVSKTMDDICSRFDALGIPFEVTDRPGGKSVESLGMEFIFENGVRLRNKISRAWKLWFATKALLQRGRVSGEVLRVWLGHVNFFFQLGRSGLSALSATYKFVNQHLGHRAVLWPNVRSELRTIQGLLFLVEHDLTATVSTTVHLGDSSTYGFALMDSAAEAHEIQRELAVREKWRFLQGRLLDDAVLEEDPDALHNHYDRGHSAVSPLGVKTSYGRELQEKLGEMDVRRHRQKKHRLFGPLRSVVETTIEAVRHPSINECWHLEDRWSLIQAAPWKNTQEHINVKEGRVLLMGLRRWARVSTNAGKTVFSLTDNMVSLLCFEKGRSNSAGMNFLCRRACAYCLGLRLQWRIRHVGTSVNVADRPSRMFDPKPHTVKRDTTTSIPFGKHVLANSVEHGEPMPVVNNSRSVVSKSEDNTFFLEVFAGSGNLTTACKSSGLRCLHPIDIRHGYTHDLSRTTTQEYLLWLVSSGIIWMIHLGTPCTIWSRARHSIQDHYRARCKELLGIRFAVFSARLIQRQLSKGHFFSLENPWGSLLWRFEPITQFLRDSRCFFIVFDACQYGAPFKKSTAILTNLEILAQLAKRCDGRHTHVTLRGSWRVKRGGKWVFENKTTTAGAYSVGLCKKWASLLSTVAPTSGFGSYGEDDDWFSGGLESAAQQNLARLGKVRTKDSTEQGGVSVDEAQRFLDRGVVFGQHSKKEALKLGGPDFDLTFPRQRLPEEEDSDEA